MQTLQNKYSEFDRVKKLYKQKAQVQEEIIASVKSFRQQLLNNSLRVCMTKLVKVILFITLIVILVGSIINFGISGIIYAGIFLSIIWVFLFEKVENWKSRVEIRALELAGDQWKHIEMKGIHAKNEIKRLKNEYRRQYDHLCVNDSSYPPDWEYRRDLVIQRDGGKCTKCGWPEGYKRKRRQFHIHHIIPLSKGGNNSLNNLTTLCSICHRNIDADHKNMLKKKKSRKTTLHTNARETRVPLHNIDNSQSYGNLNDTSISSDNSGKYWDFG